MTINNCSIGLNASAGGYKAQAVAGVVLMDSVISNTPIGVITAKNASALPAGSGSLILDNVKFTNVKKAAVQQIDGKVVLAGTTGSKTLVAWAQGHRYNPSGPTNLLGENISPNPRPSQLLVGGRYYTRTKPQYENLLASSWVSVRSHGAAGDGITDDTAAVQQAINAAVSAGKVLWFDAGTYKVTSTITIPPGARIVGESYPVIMSSGPFFNKPNKPVAVVAVGKSGSTGVVEWSDMIVSTQGRQAGAILIQWNIASPTGTPSGMWDVHTRIGGFIGSNLQGNICPTTPKITITASNYVKDCVGAFMSMHITKKASNLYMENVWYVDQYSFRTIQRFPPKQTTLKC